MKLLPAEAGEASDWEDGLWVEKPGYPRSEGSWIHPPPASCGLPEFEFQEGDDDNKNEPPPVFYVGSGGDCHVRLADERLPERVCRVLKEGKLWYVEALAPGGAVHCGSRALQAGQRARLQDGDTFTLTKPPTSLAYRIRIQEEDNWYIDLADEKDYPNKYPGRFPFRSSLPAAPPPPEELKRLAWQTDQMRRRSEEDQVRVADWSAFSQYVKRHYYKHGIECTPWATVGRHKPVEAKPPSLPPRGYPGWISELLLKERQQPGMAPERELPFASSLRASGLEAAEPLGFRGEAPRLEELYSEPFAHGPAVASGDVPARPAARVEAKEEPRANPHLRQSFREWLEAMDDSLFLLQYHDRIAANFDSLEQVHEIYVKRGEVSAAFFEDTGIKKLGHRRIFEKWFRDYCRPPL